MDKWVKRERRGGTKIMYVWLFLNFSFERERNRDREGKLGKLPYLFL